MLAKENTLASGMCDNAELELNGFMTRSPQKGRNPTFNNIYILNSTIFYANQEEENAKTFMSEIGLKVYFLILEGNVLKKGG